MRRAALLFLVVLAALPLGCAGAEGRRAQELLAQSDQALAQVKSFRFAGRLWMETSVGDFIFVMHGGGSPAKGGSSFVSMQAPDVPQFPEVTVVTRGARAWVKAGNGWQRVTIPPGQPSGIEQFDFTPYVKDVKVEDGATAGGEAAVKITGLLDTAGLVQGVFGQLGVASGGAMPALSAGLGDTRVVIYISEVSHLPLRTLVDIKVEAAGEKVNMHLDFAITNVNEPVRVPGPGA
jgi:hypothetical protein